MSSILTEEVRWTGADLELLGFKEDTRYEIIDGELFMTRAPHISHQRTCGNIHFELKIWSQSTKLGEPLITPGVIFSESDNVLPDVIWISKEQLARIVDDSGHLNGAPELVVEVLSLGTNNERRDRFAKLKLYSSRGVREYWIVDWRKQQVEVYRRGAKLRLELIVTLFETDEITSPLLPDFSCPVARFF